MSLFEEKEEAPQTETPQYNPLNEAVNLYSDKIKVSIYDDLEIDFSEIE